MLKMVEARVLAYEASGKKEVPTVAPIILMEDNLTKAKRAIMVTKVLCPTGVKQAGLCRMWRE